MKINIKNTERFIAIVVVVAFMIMALTAAVSGHFHQLFTILILLPVLAAALSINDECDYGITSKKGE